MTDRQHEDTRTTDLEQGLSHDVMLSIEEFEVVDEVSILIDMTSMVIDAFFPNDQYFKAYKSFEMIYNRLDMSIINLEEPPKSHKKFWNNLSQDHFSDNYGYGKGAVSPFLSPIKRDNRESKIHTFWSGYERYVVCKNTEIKEIRNSTIIDRLDFETSTDIKQWIGRIDYEGSEIVMINKNAPTHFFDKTMSKLGVPRDDVKILNKAWKQQQSNPMVPNSVFPLRSSKSDRNGFGKASSEIATLQAEWLVVAFVGNNSGDENIAVVSSAKECINGKFSGMQLPQDKTRFSRKIDDAPLLEKMYSENVYLFQSYGNFSLPVMGEKLDEYIISVIKSAQEYRKLTKVRGSHGWKKGKVDDWRELNSKQKDYFVAYARSTSYVDSSQPIHNFEDYLDAVWRQYFNTH